MFTRRGARGGRGNRRGVGGNQSRLFLPTGIPDLDLWLRSDLGVSTSGSNVTAWANQAPTGSSRDVAQGTASRQPQLVAGQINGHPSIRFDGTDDFMESANCDWTGKTACTIFMVGRQRRAPGTLDIWLSKGNLQGASAAETGFETGAVPSAMRQTPHGGTPTNYRSYDTAANSHPQGTTSPYFIYSEVLEPALASGSEASVWSRGVSLATSVAAAAGEPTTMDGINPYNIGRRKASAWYADFDAVEFIVYTRALSTAERRRVELYLAQRYAIATDQTFTQPTELPDLVQWLKGDVGVSVTGLGISTWADQSGNGRNATQSTDVDRPGTGTINGRASVVFDRANTESFVNTDMPATAAWTLSICGKFRSTTAGTYHDIFDDAANNIRLGAATSAATYKEIYLGDGGATRRVDPFPLNTSLHAASFAYDGTNWRITKDGATVSSTTAGSVGTVANSRIGCANVGSGDQNHADYEMGEWALYSRMLSLAEVALLRSYYQGRWGAP